MMKAGLLSLKYRSMPRCIVDCISFSRSCGVIQRLGNRQRFGLLKSLALIFGIIVTVTVNAEIYKWIDDKGNVHYGDCPPDSCDSKEIKIDSPPSEQTIHETQDRIKRIQEYQKKLREDHKENEKQAAKPLGSTVIELECFTSLDDSWGGKIQDSREQVQSRSIADVELGRLRKFFNTLNGSWKGSMVATECVKPNATPPLKIYHYDMHLDTRWKSDQIFEIDADFEGEESDATLKRQFFWFLLSRDGLRFRRAMSEIVPDLDKKKYDVEVLTVRNDALTFHFQRGGTLRRVNVFVLQKKERGFTIREYYFVQGTLAGKRSWDIE